MIKSEILWFMKVKRAIKLTGLFIQYFVIELGMFIYCSISGITSAPILGKVGIIGIYVVLALLAIFKRVVFWGLLALIVFAAVALALWMTKENDDGREYNSKGKYCNSKRMKNPFFEGMSVGEAKKEYKKLLKLYHPDNKSGDLEMTQAVIIAYNQYCVEHGCR